MRIIEWMRIKMPLAWWTQLVFGIDTILRTQALEGLMFFGGLGFLLGVWLATKTAR